MAKNSESKIQDHLELAKKRLNLCIEADDHNRKEAVSTLRFKNGEQWDMAMKQERDKLDQPTLQINVLDKYSKQVVGEMRKNKVKVKVRPVDSEADSSIAKIREGIIYNIEYLSNAEAVYDYAGQMLVDCGYGAWRVMTRYTEENPFLKEVYLERIPNPLSVYLDPNAKDANFSDAEYGFVISNIERDKFIEQYGESELPGGEIVTAPAGTLDEGWWNDQNVRVAEYFYKEKVKEKKALLSDGQILPYKEAEQIIADWQAIVEKAKADNPGETINDSKIPRIVKEREVEEVVVKWELITASNILDKERVPGKYIPLILVTGEETNIEGKRYIYGLFKNAKDPQRMLNYWHTAAAETIALAPKQPWLVTPKMIEGFEKSYANANRRNTPFLLYNIDPANPGAVPIRNAPGQVPPGIFAEIARAEQNIKDTIGMYNADVGDQGRELSGAAIMARQQPGDTSTYVFLDKLSKAVAFSGKVINEMIPEVYDTERDARMRNVDESENFVPINTSADKAVKAITDNPQKYSGMDKDKLKSAITKNGPTAAFNDITKGKYDVVITTGPSFSTQRVEAASYLAQMAPAFATMGPLDKYFIVKNLDFPGADEYAEAVRKTVPPNVLPPKEGEQPPPPPPVPPKTQAEILRVEFEIERLKTERLRQQATIARLYTDLKEGQIDVKKAILDTLQELQGPTNDRG